ncbi:MAG: toxin-antitoxin system YwqK family antitoxin [Flavobacteriales bacterium]|nr:toxin-antitoxin system YwqK family antitoxin [Flavobacteriales bacterium]
MSVNHIFLKKLSMRSKYLIVVIASLFLSCKDVRKEYFPNGVLRSEIEYKDGIPNGMYRIYYSNGIIQEEVLQVNGKFEGEGNSYYENGQLKAKVQFKNGLQEGLLIEYYEDGKIKSKQNFKKSKLEGEYQSYWKNGKVSMEALMKNDTALYYIEYDSLGNWKGEDRECHVEIPKDELYLGEEYSIKFNVAGPFSKEDKLQVSMMVYQTGGEKYPQIYFMDIKKPELKFTPPREGKWDVVGGIFLNRGGKIVWSYDQKEYSFNVLEKESISMK